MKKICIKGIRTSIDKVKKDMENELNTKISNIEFNNKLNCFKEKKD